MITKFSASQFECDLLSAAVLLWVQRNPLIEFDQVRRVILDLPWSSVEQARPLAVYVETGEAGALQIVTATEPESRMLVPAWIIETYARPVMEAAEREAKHANLA